MKLISFEDRGGQRFGAVEGDRVLDLAAASAALGARDKAIATLPARIEDFLADAERLRPSLDQVVANADAALWQKLGTVALLPPVPRPPKVVCVARNYAEHAKEAGLQVSEIPILFARFANTLVADGAPIVRPKVSHHLDWEGELAVIVGRGTKGRRIHRDEAMDYVFGYSIFNDVTVRDFQFRVSQYTAGKNFRSSGPFGPVIVTKDEIPDPHRLDIETRINGKREQFANTSDMIFPVPVILEHIAEFIDLEPGDVIATGTPAGVGFKRNPPVFLTPGDVVEVSIAGIGTLANPVVEEA